MRSASDIISELRERIEELEERNRQLEAALKWGDPDPLGVGMTPVEQAIFGVLMARDIASYNQIHLMADDVHSNHVTYEAIKVHVHHLRKKLAPLGVAIYNRSKVGYYIPKEHKDKITNGG